MKLFIFSMLLLGFGCEGATNGEDMGLGTETAETDDGTASTESDTDDTGGDGDTDSDTDSDTDTDTDADGDGDTDDGQVIIRHPDTASEPEPMSEAEWLALEELECAPGERDEGCAMSEFQRQYCTEHDGVFRLSPNCNCCAYWLTKSDIPEKYRP